MTLTEILFHPLTNLPVTIARGASYRTQLFELLENYYGLVDHTDDLKPANRQPGVDATKIRSDLRSIIDGIKATINTYLEGSPSQAYQVLNASLSSSQVGDLLWKNGSAPKYTNFFRIRKFDGNYALRKCDLFHIPFESRGIVRTQRYSIPGLPSLYISNSIYVAWEEMLRPDISRIQAVRLQNNKALKFLDLSTDDYNQQESNSDFQPKLKEVIQKLMTWPVIAACSFKVTETEAHFKPEYIIPQLLLQWISQHELDGIKYSSTHINTAHRRQEGVFYNVVLPVKTFDLETGFCPKLNKLFKSTEVLPMQLTQFATSTGSFYQQVTIDSNVNRDIFTLELISGKEEPYWHTSFGRLEHALKDLELGDIVESD